MCQGVHTDVEVGDVDTHGLLPHGRLVGVPGRLVVVGERNDAGTHTCTHHTKFTIISSNAIISVAFTHVLHLEVTNLLTEHALARDLYSRDVKHYYALVEIIICNCIY